MGEFRTKINRLRRTLSGLPMHWPHTRYFLNRSMVIKTFHFYALQIAAVLLVLSPLELFANGNAIKFVEEKQQANTLGTVSDVAVSTDGEFVYSAAVQSGAVAAFKRDLVTGVLAYSNVVTTATVPTLTAVFGVATSPDNKNIYTASPTTSTSGTLLTGAITAFSRDPVTGALTVVNDQRAGQNGITLNGFVTLMVSPDGRNVYAVTGNNPDGIAVFTRNVTTGALTLLEQHTDDVNGNYLGQAFSQNTSPIKNIAISENGKYLYVSATDDNAVSVYSRDLATGSLTLSNVYRNGIDGVDGITKASSLLLSNDGNHLYVSGQGISGITPVSSAVAIFSVNQTTGALTYLNKVTQGAGGVTSINGARSLGSSPDGRYIYVSAIISNTVTAFARDADTGLLTVDSVAANGVGGVNGLSAASGMQADPLGRHLYVAGQNSQAIAVFALPSPAIVLSNTSITAVVNGPAVTLDPNLEIQDSDSLNLVSAHIAISEGFKATDVLSIGTQNGITVTHNSAGGVIDLTGSATLADYQALLRTLAYQAGVDSTLAPNGSSARRISITVSDGENQSAAVVLGVTVQKIVASPVVVLSGPAAEAVVEGAPVTLDSAMSVTGADGSQLVSATVEIVDGWLGSDELSVSSSGGLVTSYNASTGVLQITGTASIASYQTVLRNLQFKAGADASLSHGQTSSRSIRLTVSDGEVSSLPVNIAVTVKKVVPQVATGILGTPGMVGTVIATLTSPEPTCGFEPGSGFAPASDAPADTDLPFGVFEFKANGCNTLTVTLQYPEPLPGNATFWKYGPAVAGATESIWFEWTGPLSISLDRKTVSYVIKDNGVGDSDPAVSKIADPFAIGVKATPPIAPESTITSVPTNSPLALALLSALLGACFWLGRKRLLG